MRHTKRNVVNGSTAWDKKLEDFMIEAGEEGWELVSVVPRSSFSGQFGPGGTLSGDFAGFTTEELYIFKREKQ
ncbi:MAG: hypothetical protein IPP69_13540 [Flavobacteriales bacterium]|nr:hypothetical protein [Flavobacteriales bacterium]